VTGAEPLAGNGVALVRARSIAARVQAGLERLYHLDRVADVQDHILGVSADQREALLLREDPDGALEVGVWLPALVGDAGLDALCQLIEGVSHFVYVVERARVQREATQLELELQAEVDKWVVLGASIRTFDAETSASLREKLYDRVAYADEAETELGRRYRLANDVAHRFVRRLERNYIERGRIDDLRAELLAFFQVGQEGKLRLAAL
jgi:hypothetical protein